MSQTIKVHLVPKINTRSVGSRVTKYVTWADQGIRLVSEEFANKHHGHFVTIYQGLPSEAAFGHHGVPEGAEGTLIPAASIIDRVPVGEAPQVHEVAHGDVLDTVLGQFRITASTDPYGNAYPYLVHV